MSSKCEHDNFICQADVNRIVESPEDQNAIAFTAEVKISCQGCGLLFEFVGLPLGLSFYEPTVSIDRQTLRVPIAPPGMPPRPGLAGFTMKMPSFDEDGPVN